MKPSMHYDFQLMLTLPLPLGISSLDHSRQLTSPGLWLQSFVMLIFVRRCRDNAYKLSQQGCSFSFSFSASLFLSPGRDGLLLELDKFSGRPLERSFSCPLLWLLAWRWGPGCGAEQPVSGTRTLLSKAGLANDLLVSVTFFGLWLNLRVIKITLRLTNFWRFIVLKNVSHFG